jgi:hypothetical protein
MVAIACTLCSVLLGWFPPNRMAVPVTMRSGPAIRPRPDTPPQTPIARPRCSGGKASVSRAVLLAKRKAPPTPCTRRKISSSMAPWLPVPGVRESMIEPSVKMAKPRLYILTRPTMSEMRPSVTSSVAVTTI